LVAEHGQVACAVINEIATALQTAEEAEVKGTIDDRGGAAAQNGIAAQKGRIGQTRQGPAIEVEGVNGAAEENGAARL